MLDDLVRSAFVYAYPLFAFAQTRFAAVDDTGQPHRHDANTIRHNRTLSDHRAIWITAPNNDTLYSNAWLDLSHGPVRIRAGTMPEGRYWSLAFMDAFTNHFAVVGQRLEGCGPVDLLIAGPGEGTDRDGARVINAPGQDAWLFCRCIVDGPDDLPAAHAMQDTIRIDPAPGVSHAQRIRPVSAKSPANFLDVVNELLHRNSPPARDVSLLRRWQVIGLRPGGPGAFEELGTEEKAAWSRVIDPAYNSLAAAGREGRQDFNGWIAAASDIGNFGDNHALRASVALGGLGALEPIEAMYFVKYQDEDNHPLDGTSRYRLTVPASGIPTGSFWSFTMYAATPDGKRVLVENPINRYSIGNRTQALEWNGDGSLNIFLQHNMPVVPTERANWLPAPLGPFQLALRAYVPGAELRNGRARLPTISRISD